VALANSLAIIKCFNFMGYDTIGIATHDLQMGIPFLKELEKEASFPFLSANIVDKKSGALEFTPYTLINKGNLHIGIVGITGQLPENTENSYVIQDWQQALDKTLQQLPEDMDMLVLLSNLSHDENISIARKYQDIHIILEAGQSLNGQQLQLVDNTILTHTPKEGKYVGELKIDWQKAKTWQTEHLSHMELRNEIDRLNWFKNRIDKRGGAQEAYRQNPTALQDYNEKMQHLQRLQTELANRTEPKEDADIITYSSYQQSLHPLRPAILDEPQTTQILKNSRKTANTLRRKKDVSQRFDVYAGSDSCKSCHEFIYESYQKTSHSTAFSTLVNKADDNNPNCIFCHVTGLPERLAHIQALIPQRLQQVGCEACHGPGKQHIQNPAAHRLTQAVPETICLTCHTEDHSDDFNYTRDVGLVH
jgi:hypothetical protein